MDSLVMQANQFGVVNTHTASSNHLKVSNINDLESFLHGFAKRLKQQTGQTLEISIAVEVREIDKQPLAKGW